MLKGIVALLEEHGRLTLREIAGHFHMEPAAIEPMLDMLVSKGLIRVYSGECAKGSCSGCFCTDRQDLIIYESAEHSPDEQSQSSRQNSE